MKESVTQFGKNVKLTGVVTKPDNVSTDLPAVIIFNSGVRHHVGCCRMSVNIAREMADIGLPSMRFDLSGIGDSPLRSDAKPYEQSSIEEAQEAMDYLSRTLGVNQFIFYGLCSGAHLGFKTAQIDERVVGIIQIDGYLYRTTKYYLVHYLPRLFSLSAWITFFKNRVEERASANSASDDDEMQLEVQEWPETPPKETSEKGYRILVDRSVEMLSFITGATSADYNYKEQFFDMFPGFDFQSKMAVEYMPDASHILREQVSQERVLSTVKSWVQNKFLA